MTSRLLVRAARGVSFQTANPEWADMAYEVLFRKEGKDPYDLQYAVAQALKVAWEMGRDGRSPPPPKGMEPRKYQRPAGDPTLDEIAEEMRHLAWSPMAGTEPPEGQLGWEVSRSLQRRSNVKAVRPVENAVVTRRVVRRG